MGVGVVGVRRMRLGEQWVASGLLASAQVEAALACQGRWRCRLGEAAVRLGLLAPEQLLITLAQQLQVPFIRREGLERVPAGLMRCVPTRVLARLRVCPLRVEWRDEVRGTVFVATSEPGNLHMLDDMAFATGCAVRPVLALSDDIEDVLRRHGVLHTRPRSLELDSADANVRLRISHDSFAH
ncbi:pilus assembly protein PilB [Archangium violaceum]|uniref:GspE/PulE/PilB domain-containing protein n=1 Tax=Archangium violaceum TaxID=83451 RepID=UPI00194DCB2F|nr:pilus assembly protein PilB [Archangium violaceum]QRN99017.1 pilus assembly protein PilB [Archangium violaceum]